ncbi:hypothetical protein Tco_0529802 [Tanacetum coccineum]
MSSDSASFEVTYMSISSHKDPLAWAVDFFGFQEPDSLEAAPASPDYVLALRSQSMHHLRQIMFQVQRYVADSDPEEDSEDGPVDYPAYGGDDDDDDDSSNDDEEEEALEEEGEEHLALANSVVAPVVDLVPSAKEIEPFETDESAATPLPPPTYRTTAKMSIRAQAPIPFPSEAEILSPPLPLPSPPLPASLFIPPPVDHREDTPEAELPPHKRLCLTAPTSRFEVGESLTAAARPTRGHRVDYGFIGTLDAKIRRQRAEEVDYGIRDVWVDPAEAVKEVAPTTLERVNDRVAELAKSRRIDQGQRVSPRDCVVDGAGGFSVSRGLGIESLTATLVAQISFLQRQLSAALGQIQALQARDQTHADDLEGADSYS